MGWRGACVGLVALGGALLWAAPAGAADLDGGCEGSAVSSDADGNVLDEASAPGAGATKGNPFLVDTDGVVAYQGSTPAPFRDHSWQVDVMGITVKSGGSENAEDQTTTDDEAEISDYLPFDAPGLYKVSGSIDPADGEGCSGSGWVKIAGSPVGSPPWIAGAVSTAGGLALLAWAWPTR